MNVRKFLRILHRDLGYFIVGMTIVYALSGIYLNHRHDFNPDYKIVFSDYHFNLPTGELSAADVKKAIQEVNNDVVFKKHYISNEGLIRVFIENGEIVIDPKTGDGSMRYLERRTLIYSLNMLHRASIGTVWKWVSDTMAIILLFVAISGIFLLKGKRSFTRWGWWLIAGGIIVPLVFALLFI